MAIDYESLGKRIANARKQTGITQEALGEQLNMTRKHISVIETAINRPSLDTLVDIALAFQLPAVLYRAHTGGDHIHFLSCHNLLLSSSLATGLILHASSAGCRRASYARHNSLRYCGNLQYWNPSLPRSWCHRTSGP